MVALLIAVDLSHGIVKEPWLPLCGMLLLLLTIRRKSVASSGVLRWLVAALLLLDGTTRIHVAFEKHDAAKRESSRVERLLGEVEIREMKLYSTLVASAGRVAETPKAASALSGDATSLSALFSGLEKYRISLSSLPVQDLALSVRSTRSTTIAWAGRALDAAPFRDLPTSPPRIFADVGSIATTLVAIAPIVRLGETLGYATAELRVVGDMRVRRRPHGQFSSVWHTSPRVEIRYFGHGEEASRVGSDTPDPPLAHTTVLRESDGAALARVRVTGRPLSERIDLLLAWYRHAAALLTVLIFIVWTLRPTRPDRVRIILGATLLRLALFLLISPSRHSLDIASGWSHLAAGFLSHPLDAWLTSLWILTVAICVLSSTLARQRSPRPLGVAMIADLAAIPLLAATFVWMAGILASLPFEFETISLALTRPRDMIVLTAALMGMTAGGSLLLALLVSGGQTIRQPRRLAIRLTYWIALGLVAYRYWPRHTLGLPMIPTLLLFSSAAALAVSYHVWLPAWRAASAADRFFYMLAFAAFISLLLYPSAVHYSEKSLRRRIESDFVKQVRRQPQRRRVVLASSCRRIDESLDALDRKPVRARERIEELAFTLWSETALAEIGFSSAVELRDRDDNVISRFALNLASLSGAPPDRPESTTWRVSSERLTVGSAVQEVLHARRLVAIDGRSWEELHVYVADDYWNLPFLSGRDPYSLPARTLARPNDSGHVQLAVWDDHLRPLFSSSERHPSLHPSFNIRIREKPSGFWTTLLFEGRSHHAFAFADSERMYALGYPRLGPVRFAADFAETIAVLMAVIITMLIVSMAVRGALRRSTAPLSTLWLFIANRFALRLFASFIAVALLPAIVLQVTIREFVADRLRRETDAQALERATVARKAVEDFAHFLGSDAPTSQPVTDDALVWIASLIRNDLDLFIDGELTATSKRELYASGLLPRRASGAVFRALVLDKAPFVLHTELTAGLTHQVVSIPVRLDASRADVLSLPLASRERELTTVLADLNRFVRLASVLFIFGAAGLAHSMTRRISKPIADLTHAAQRIAQGDLGARVASARRDELRRLVEAFNQMARDLERQRIDLERSNRLAAWAEMARQVAHEVKNPLTPIQLSAEHLRRVHQDRSADFDATLETCTQTILKQVRTLRSIVTEFSAFARPPAPASEPVRLSRLVEEVLDRYMTALPPKVRLSFARADTDTVIGDRRLIERAIVNLVENALQAVGDNDGSIDVLVARADEGRSVKIVMTDSGPGVSENLSEKVFEPFFSTKSGGSGLGLWLVKKIAEDHGGRVWIENAPPGGARVTFLLPSAATKPRATKADPGFAPES
ncbi:MAG: HAMP domain-containing protein [Vicinamibacteria bacterium]|nr:HAMP domain-containing protein [Vicinamibacteria bacterium]